jgi:hypothetical protein
LSLGKWNARCLYRTGSLITVAKEVAKYKLEIEGVQEVRWGRDGTEPEGNYKRFYRNGNKNHDLGTGFFGHKKII